jgi:hypothetical protein
MPKEVLAAVSDIFSEGNHRFNFLEGKGLVGFNFLEGKGLVGINFLEGKGLVGFNFLEGKGLVGFNFLEMNSSSFREPCIHRTPASFVNRVPFLRQSLKTFTFPL